MTLKFINLCSKYFLLLFFSFLWSLLLFFYWSYDYGLYYNQGVNLSEDFKIYLNFFDTKGPVYFYFINIISKAIGIGKLQSYITLSLTVFLFFGSIYYIVSQKTQKNFFLLLFFLISILHQQNINVSIVLFQASLQIMSFYFLFKTIQHEKKYYLILSSILFSLSFFTKIDVIVYLPIYLLAILFLSKKLNKFLYIFIFLFSCFVIYIYLSIILDFNFNDFWWHNYTFNVNSSSGLWNREPFIKIFNSPYHIYLIMFTGVGVLFFDVFDKYIIKKNINISKILTNYKTNRELILYILIILAGAFAWLYSGSDKNYHVFMIFLPLIFFISNNFDLLNNFKFKLFFYYLLTFFFFLITLYPDTKNVILKKCWKNDIYCYNISSYDKIVDDLNNYNSNQEIFILGSAGWPYLFANIKIDKSLANYMLYSDVLTEGERVRFNLPKYVIEDHKKLLNKDNNFIFWIEKSLVNNFENSKGLVPSIYLRELLEKSTKIKLQGNFYKYKIK